MALTELTGGKTPAGAKALTAPPVECTIATTPGSLGEDLYVLIDPGSTEQTGPCRWMPSIDVAGDQIFPQRGDPAVVAITGQGHRFLAWWQPQ